MKLCNYLILVSLLTTLHLYNVRSQSVSVTEEEIYTKTYFFNSPNPVSALTYNPKIYPYFEFQNYEQKAKKKKWKVVTLENKYIKLFVLPEIGGKVWGAIEKQTGEEFLYKNEVMKFRKIALRGPWISGGLEFNFGIIGHTPTTATSVDYMIKKNENNNVSCIVGVIDLPSRTFWRVEINLQEDKAYFETKASWYNPTPLNQSYYNWMTAAAEAKDDLEFFVPGNNYLAHDGNAFPWPVDNERRKLSLYKDNNFGSHKSYHVVGDYKDFFGGYYHDTKFGFGHWALYEEMPGQKLWLWALSRSGGIWEDLLTDDNGQYIEFQAGRLFNQFLPKGLKNPITQANFGPYVMDRWTEIWFPYKEIGGMVDASKYGVLNVEVKKNETYVGINALQKIDENLKIRIDGSVVFTEKLKLKPMEVFETTIPIKSSNNIEVMLGNNKLYYTNNNDKTLLKRPFHSHIIRSESQQLLTDGLEAMKYREYNKALVKLKELITIDPYHREALIKLAELECRRTNYKKALSYADKALQIDTYHAESNYIMGVIYRELRDHINALESLGWAARDMKYRSASYAQMAEIYLSQDNAVKATIYALKALDFNTYNINARQILIILSRKQKDVKEFNHQVKELLEIDPLHHFANFEIFLMHSSTEAKNKMLAQVQNEFAEETLLELALQYERLGLHEEAIAVLYMMPKNTKIKLWLAYLSKDVDPATSDRFLKDVLNASVNFVFPFRTEFIPVLQWAHKKQPHWKLKFYLAQNYLAVGKKNEGKKLLKDCKNIPDADVFYRFRAEIFENEYMNAVKDYEKALVLNPEDWMVWYGFIRFYLENNKHEEAYRTAYKAFKKYPKNYNIELCYAEALLGSKKYTESIEVLKNCNVIPSENAKESKFLYNYAHILLANENIREGNYDKAVKLLTQSKEWPENLGVGKPYEADTRQQDFFLAICFGKLNKSDKKEKLLKKIVDYTHANINKPNVNHLFGLLSSVEPGIDHEADKLIAIMEKPTEEQNDKNELAVAFFKKDMTKLSELKKKNIINTNLWDIMEAALNY